MIVTYDPAAHAETDIDVVMADDINQKVLPGECKWRESFNLTDAVASLHAHSALIRAKGERMYYVFGKRPVAVPHYKVSAKW